MQLTESPNDLARQVADEVRAIMARRRLSQQAVAEAAGMTQSYLGRRLVGVIAFDVTDLERLSRVLDVPVASLLPGVAA